MASISISSAFGPHEWIPQLGPCNLVLLCALLPCSFPMCWMHGNSMYHFSSLWHDPTRLGIEPWPTTYNAKILPLGHGTVFTELHNKSPGSWRYMWRSTLGKGNPLFRRKRQRDEIPRCSAATNIRPFWWVCFVYAWTVPSRLHFQKAKNRSTCFCKLIVWDHALKLFSFWSVLGFQEFAKAIVSISKFSPLFQVNRIQVSPRAKQEF